ncbi:MAG TPA: APC family permease [Solirubrobacteraceae bacterium]|nr:APC family permease [Solirubrobacteraceae bacterium]
MSTAETPESQPDRAGQPKQMTVRGATVLGIGSMIGAGIFALLGEAGAVAGAAVWISFLVGGVVAGLLGYVCVKLGVRYPSSGGLITYLVEGFGLGRLVGVASWLGYIAAVVIVCSMVVVSFGAYATSLFVGENAGGAWNHIFITALVIVMVAVNLVGARFVARAQSVIVTGVLIVFAVFICVTLPNINLDLLAFSGYPSASKIVASVALTFFAYLGFNVITFTAGDLRDPSHDLPRAMYGALGVTATVYVLIALGVFGTLTVTQVIGYGETAIAEAARPTLGDAGFTVMAVAALLSTAGATNATLYASGNLTGMLAELHLFPAFFGSGSRLGRHAGLLITAAIVLVVANLVDLSAIASVGSAVALMIFVLVGVAGWRRRADTGSNPVIVLLAIAVTAIVLVFFAVNTLQTEPWTFIAIIALTVLSFALDAAVRRGRGSAGDAAHAPAV